MRVTIRLGLVVAMAREYDLLLDHLTGAEPVDFSRAGAGHSGLHGHRGRLGSAGVTMARCGIGKVNAALGARALLVGGQEPMDLLLSVGVSGGLREGMRVGDLLLCEGVAYHDVWCGEPNQEGQVQGLPQWFMADGPFLARVRALLGDGEGVFSGRFLCGERFIPGPEELRRMDGICATAVGVDMESGAVGQTCHLYGVGFGAIRAVSDTPGRRGVDSAAQYESFWAGSASRRAFARIADALAGIGAESHG